MVVLEGVASAAGSTGRMEIDMKVDIVERHDTGCSSHLNDHLLVREITHRINNEFASIIGRASMIAARSTSEEVKKALAAVTRILHDCADVHRSLEMPTLSTMVDASDYVRALCQSIKRAKLDGRGIELVLVEHPLQMRSERCWMLGMIVSELITNSARHAFGDRGGQIQIKLSGAGPYAQCSVTDNGSSRDPGTPGQGLKIIEALVKELDGKIVHRFGTDGAVTMLMFPINGMEHGSWIKDEERTGRRFAAYPS